MIRLAALCVFLLASYPQDPPKTAYFFGPAGAKESELKEAAKALLKRCEAIGWKGMTSEVATRNGKKLVALTCETGFPFDRPRLGGLTMHRQAERLAYWATLDSFELRFVRPVLMPAERQQYHPGKTPDRDAAPKGTTWTRFHRLHLRGDNPEEATLLFDEPVLRKLKDSKDPKNDLVSEGGKFKLKQDAHQRVKKFYDQWKGPLSPSLSILVDGKIFDGYEHGGSMGVFSESDSPKAGYIVAPLDLLQVAQVDAKLVLLHPSPIPLTLVYPGFLGLDGEPATNGRGILLNKVNPEGAAARAGLKVGDVIFSIAGTKTDTLAVLRSVIGKHFEGDEVEVAYFQEGAEKTIKIVLGGRKD